MIVPTLIITGGNLARMLILATAVTQIYLIVSTQFASMFTKLAAQVGTIEVPAGQMLSWFGIEAPVFRWTIAQASDVINGNFMGLIFFAAWVVCFFYYVSYMKKRNIKLDEAEKQNV